MLSGRSASNFRIIVTERIKTLHFFVGSVAEPGQSYTRSQKLFHIRDVINWIT